MLYQAIATSPTKILARIVTPIDSVAIVQMNGSLRQPVCDKRGDAKSASTTLERADHCPIGDPLFARDVHHLERRLASTVRLAIDDGIRAPHRRDRYSVDHTLR